MSFACQALLGIPGGHSYSCTYCNSTTADWFAPSRTLWNRLGPKICNGKACLPHLGISVRHPNSYRCCNTTTVARFASSPGIARHRGFASLTHSKSQSRIVVTSAAAHGRIVKTVKKVTTYMVGTVKRQNTSSSERSWRKIAETRQSLFRKSAWSGYAHKMCAVDSNTKRLYSNEMSDRATHFTVFMIMNCPVEQQILAAYGSIVDSRQIAFK